MTPMWQARFGIAGWRFHIAWIEVKAGLRALFGPHPWTVGANDPLPHQHNPYKTSNAPPLAEK